MSRDGIHVAAFCVLERLLRARLWSARHTFVQLEVSADGVSASLMRPRKDVKSTSIWGLLPYEGSKMSKSTGPRTPRGKARSSQNAAKHWIQSGRILPEEQREAAILRSGFAEDLKPQGLIEQEVIDDLTLNRLIKRRIDLAFTREFSKANIEKTIKWLENHERPVAEYWLRKAKTLGINRAEGQQAERLRPDACILLLEAIEHRIAERGPQPQDLVALRDIYGDQPTGFAASAMYVLLHVAEQWTVENNTPQDAAQEDRKKQILALLRNEIELQKSREVLEKAAHAPEFASSIQEPPPAVLDTLLRYSATNLREFKDRLDCFERLRRLRLTAA